MEVSAQDEEGTWLQLHVPVLIRRKAHIMEQPQNPPGIQLQFIITYYEQNTQGKRENKCSILTVFTSLSGEIRL